MTTAQHPARSRSGFAGLRLVPQPTQEDEPDPVSFTVQITVQDGQATLTWDPHTPDVGDRLFDLADVIQVAIHSFRDPEQDVAGWVQRAYENRVAMRESIERQRAEFEAEHPWVCACGKRCKSESGLGAHIRAGDPKCGRG